MAEHIIHEFDKEAFNCPRCGAFSNQKWYLAIAIDKYNLEFHGKMIKQGNIDEYAFAECVHCNQVSIWDKEKSSMIYPKSNNRTFDLAEVPKDLSEDYSEACLVIGDSPKASAALSRRCLQAVLRE